jgi:hypothetical protein
LLRTITSLSNANSVISVHTKLAVSVGLQLLPRTCEINCAFCRSALNIEITGFNGKYGI